MTEPAMLRRCMIRGKGSRGARVFGCSHQDHRTVSFQELDIGIIIVECRHGVEHKVEVPPLSTTI